MSLGYFYILIVCMIIGLPVAIGLIFAPMSAFMLTGKAIFVQMVPQRLFAGINQSPLLAIPLFILAGELMNHGGITERLIRFSDICVGRLRGGLAQVNILASILFAGLSGSAVADTSALGSMLVPAMEKDGYTREFSAAVTAASSVIGPIIPPSIVMVVYAYVMNMSVGALFAGGIVPGLLVGGSLMGVTAYLARKHSFPKKTEKLTLGEHARITIDAIPPLMTPIIIIGGILSGIFSPTEAAAVAVGYSFIVTFFFMRTISLRDIPAILKRSGLMSANIMIMVGAAVVFAWITSISQVPAKFAEEVLALTTNKYLLLILANLILLFVGMFLDAGPAILILGPILMPVMTQAGVDPLHFAIVMCVNLCIGLATPPFGLVLFVISTITGLRVETVAKSMLPYLAVQLAVIVALAFIPDLALFVPRMLGML